MSGDADPSASTLLPALARHERSASLDGWRAVAILWVMLSHALPPGAALASLRRVGVHGVFIFFVLSGFLITTRLADEAETGRGVDLPAFYLRRFFRILPAALTYLTVIAVLTALGLVVRGGSHDLLAAGLFVVNYVGHGPAVAPYTSHFWSLAVEEHFYLLFPLLFAAVGPRRLRWVSLALYGVGAIWRGVDDTWFQSERLLPGVPSEFRTDHVFDLLLIGCALAVWTRDERVRAALARILRPSVWLLVMALLAGCIWQPPPLARSLEGLCLALLIGASVVRPRDLPSRLLAARPLAALGRISYSVYLWQALFFVAAFRTPSWPQRFPLNLIFTLICACLSYFAVERPMLERGAELVRARARRRALAAGSAVPEPFRPDVIR